MVFVVYTSVPNQNLTNVTCIGNDVMERQLCILFMYSAKSGKCLTCDQRKWRLPHSDKCDYFTASCDAALQQCLVNCEGIVLT